MGRYAHGLMRQMREGQLVQARVRGFSGGEDCILDIGGFLFTAVCRAPVRIGDSALCRVERIRPNVVLRIVPGDQHVILTGWNGFDICG